MMKHSFFALIIGIALTGSSLGTALRALATTVRMAKVQTNRVRGRRDTR